MKKSEIQHWYPHFYVVLAPYQTILKQSQTLTENSTVNQNIIFTGSEPHIACVVFESTDSFEHIM